MWRAVIVGMALGAGLAPASARGEAPRPACRFPGEPAVTAEQQKRLEILGANINALAPQADCRPLAAQLARLLDEPCFRGLKNISPPPTCGSGLALRDWWREGGHWWVQSADADRPRGRIVLFPPTVRPALDLASSPGHPLAALLCPAGDAACGRETGGWLRRIEDAATARPARPRPSVGDVCNKVSGASPRERYASWRDCVEQERRRRFTALRLPASAFRAPVQGWLVVRGRRGHYTFSDELAAFDLETGSAYRALRRGDLGIDEPADAEAVERRRTGRRKIVVERGRVPLDNLREAALGVLLSSERQPQVAKVEVGLPLDIEIVPLPKPFVPSPPDPIITENSGDTWLSWEWLRGGKLVASGTMKYTGLLSRGAEDPTWLLEIAEAGLQPGCPPARLPPGVLGRGRPIPDVSPVDATRDELDESEVGLARALTARDPACAQTK